MAAVPQQSTSLAELRTVPQPREAQLPNVRAGFSDLAGFELVQRAAKALAASTLVPKEYQDNVPNCIVALELAQRIGASPLMVMQNLDVVHGRPTWRGQFVIACINQCGRYTELQFEWGGTEGKDDWSCRAWAKSKSTGERVQGPKVSIHMAKEEGWYSKTGSKWKTIPELMLMYRAGAWFGRTNAPELTMGLNSSEEARDIIDVEQVGPGRFEATLDTLQPGAHPAGAAQPLAEANDVQPESENTKGKPRAKGNVTDVQPASNGAPEPFTDEALALKAMDAAKDEGEASAVLDRCKGQPFRAHIVTAYNKRFAETVG